MIVWPHSKCRIDALGYCIGRRYNKIEPYDCSNYESMISSLDTLSIYTRFITEKENRPFVSIHTDHIIVHDISRTVIF